MYNNSKNSPSNSSRSTNKIMPPSFFLYSATSCKIFWFVLFLHYKSVKDLSSYRAVALDLSKANKIQKYGNINFFIFTRTKMFLFILCIFWGRLQGSKDSPPFKFVCIILKNESSVKFHAQIYSICIQRIRYVHDCIIRCLYQSLFIVCGI